MYADMENEGLDSAGGGAAMMPIVYEEKVERDRKNGILTSSGLPTAQTVIEASAGTDEVEILVAM